jgi:hypothetical protein
MIFNLKIPYRVSSSYSYTGKYEYPPATYRNNEEAKM